MRKSTYFFAPVSVYPTRDGYVYIAVGNDRQWDALTTLPGFETLAEPQYQHNAGRIADGPRLDERLGACARQLTTAALSVALNAIGVPVAKVNNLKDVLAEPLLQQALTRVRDPRTGTELVLSPLAEIGDNYASTLAFPPRLGEHNEAIYGGVLGRDAQQLAAWKERGII